MKRWEYTIVPLSNLITKVEAADALNQLGERGWELVAIDFDRAKAYLKRPVCD
jgi:hypothetical protein